MHTETPERCSPHGQETSLQLSAGEAVETPSETFAPIVVQEHNLAVHEGHNGINLTTENDSEGSAGSREPKVTHAFDVLGNRRKRRKVSQEPEGHVLETRADASVPNTDTEDPSPGLFSQKAAEVPPQTEIVSDIDGLPIQEPSTPRRRRGRPPKAVTTQREKPIGINAVKHHHAEKGDTSGAQETATPKKQRTPRKKTMQISATGKLFEEPAKSSTASLPQVGVIDSAKTPQTGRNLTLKNGKFAQTRVVVMRYQRISADPNAFGKKVQEIFLKPAKPRTSHGKIPLSKYSKLVAGSTSKSTHPFFLGKPQRKAENASPTISLEPTGQTTDEENPNAEVKKPVAWKDIVFKSNKPIYAKDLLLEKSTWPPLCYQHVRPLAETVSSSGSTATLDTKRKSKLRGAQVKDEENLIFCFSRDLSQLPKARLDIVQPNRVQTTAQSAMSRIRLKSSLVVDVPAISAARQRALNNFSAFDRAEAPGPLAWTQQYAPASGEQVLQPQCHELYEWLRGLAVHHVKQGLDPSQARPAPKRRKKQKKRDDELEDFIVQDDQHSETNKIKNAIMIVGPSGCGKTASVYAVAKQLGFEVFEIHAGMRRSQKDIFDKVGDMAQNHMVQRGGPLSRDPSVLNEPDLSSSQEEQAQPSVAAFLVGQGKKKAIEASRPATPQPNKEQKQSLILFEEVDHIFEDDRGFWTGVQSLIQNSKRPVVLTCNDLENTPMDELDLHKTLTYTAPDAEVAAEYLAYIAAAEGHLIEPSAIEDLYRSKGDNLRGTITELDFWCQMTVGSNKCGLDWLPDCKTTTNCLDQPRERIFSQNTFHEGLDLVPELRTDIEHSMQYVGMCLDLPVDALLDVDPGERDTSHTSTMQQMLAEAEIMSTTDMLEATMKPVLYTTVINNRHVAKRFTDRAELVRAKIAHQHRGQKRLLSFACLEPLTAERPVFPPAQGRLAPSLDLPRSVLAADIAPYVRCIASFDQRLEQQRDELFSSQGKKSRTTRAARAAAEGGDKASTRRERWFPPSLNLEAVLRTGNSWPQWLEDGGIEDTLVSTTP